MNIVEIYPLTNSSKNTLRKLAQLSLVIAFVLGLMLIFTSEKAQAQWPPFRFRLTPAYEKGKIIYRITFSTSVDWSMTDVTFKIPLPAGTRFLEAHAQPSTSVEFDGTEVKFFTATLNRRSIRDASFVVEVIDPALTVFTTHAWIAWRGDQPGDYLTEDISVDITKQPLNWQGPPRSRLQLEMTAAATEDVITYTLYPLNSGGRMWDLKINIPLPVGTTFLSAEAPPAFVTNFNGQEVSFSTAELEAGAVISPLKFTVSTVETTDLPLATHAWATWKNVGRNVTVSVAAQEETRTGDIIVQPQASQWVVMDTIGDVPFPSYDITSIAFQDDGPALKIVFHTVAALRLIDERMDYTIFIDKDCRGDTGAQRHSNLGEEASAGYRHDTGVSDFRLWDAVTEEWRQAKSVEVRSQEVGNMVSLWIPYGYLEKGKQFCWTAEAKFRTDVFDQQPPVEYIPDSSGSKLTRSEIIVTTPTTATSTFAPAPFAGAFINGGDIWQYLPGWAKPPANWQAIDFDDSNWLSGPTRIGYGSDDYATDLSLVTPPAQNDGTPLLMQRTITETGVTLAVIPSGEAPTIFMRRAFNITDPAKLTQLTLEIEYEGGFIAYLNGLEIARRNLGNPNSPVSFDALAVAYQRNTSPEVIDLSNYIPQLVTGTNVLAIQAHRLVDSSELSITPKLTWAYNPVVTASFPTDPNIFTPGSAPLSTPQPLGNIRGKLAIPLDDSRVAYHIHIFSLPHGEELVKIPNARQPNFRFDGQRLLINREGGGAENLYEYNLIDGSQRPVSDAPRDSHPFYDSYGNRVVYANPELTYGKPEPAYKENKWYYTGVPKPFIFVQCGLLPPHQEKEPRCRDIPTLGVLVPAGQVGELQGTHPVWTANDMIAYKGCNSWAGFGACGIYIVPSSSTKGFSDGFIPRQLTKDTSDIPTDTKGNLIAFMSYRDKNWEAYVMDLNGAGVKNLSNSPGSNDGLPTLSPDGNWVAFVSDRGGRWAVWAAPVAGGPAQKLFDLPETPWGDGDRAWTNERISWGP